MRISFLLALPVVALAADAQAPAFEVASIKPADPNATVSDFRGNPEGGLVGVNMNLRSLVMMAYHLQPFQLAGGPPWLRSRRFDITAKAPAGTAKNETRPMLQALLAERFHLAVHKETREVPVYNLVVAKAGPKIHPARRPPDAANDGVETFAGRIKGAMLSMSGLATALASDLRRPVIDRTNLDGKYDFDLQYAVGNTDDDHASVFTALQEQLGLKLEASKGPVEILVVDHAELPTEN